MFLLLGPSEIPQSSADRQMWASLPRIVCCHFLPMRALPLHRSPLPCLYPLHTPTSPLFPAYWIPEPFPTMYVCAFANGLGVSKCVTFNVTGENKKLHFGSWFQVDAAEQTHKASHSRIPILCFPSFPFQKPTDHKTEGEESWWAQKTCSLQPV